jgi:hypothetical protein
MTKIINFNKVEEQEEHTCETCELVDDLMETVLNAESHEELYETLFFYVDEAKKLGFQNALRLDIEHKVDVLNAINEEDECDCEDCLLD